MFKKIIHIISLFLFVTSCSGTFDSVKRGLTGAKADKGDEFLVKKKDPLILPPDFENLPSPDERTAVDEVSELEKKLEILVDDSTQEATSAEDSILKKIRSK